MTNETNSTDNLVVTDVAVPGAMVATPVKEADLTDAVNAAFNGEAIFVQTEEDTGGEVASDSVTVH